MNNNELMHYGVKGMKWGVRKKRPTAEKSRNRHDKNEENDSQKSKKKKKKLSKKQKALIIAAAVVAAYATYKFVDSGTARQLAEKGKAFINGKEAGFKMNLKYSQKGMDKDTLKSRVVDGINSDYGSFGSKTNCRRCTFAYEMRRRGFDVSATKSNSGTGQSFQGLYNATHKDTIKGGRFGAVKRIVKDQNLLDEIKKTTISNEENSSSFGKKIFDTISEKNPNGSRGELELTWKVGGAHSIAWEIVDNKTVFFDCQTNEMFDSVEKFSKYSSNASSVKYTRLDNVDLNKDFLLRWLKND